MLIGCCHAAFAMVMHGIDLWLLFMPLNLIKIHNNQLLTTNTFIMRNIINTRIHGLDIQAIDDFMPFENKEVWVWNIAKTKTGYGNWDLFLELHIEGVAHTLKAHTTDSIMIDYWAGLEDEDDYPEWLEDDYKGSIDAIDTVLIANDAYLSELFDPIEQ